MFKKGQKKGTVRFTLSGNALGEKAQLAGDFNGWKPVAMRKQKSGFGVTVDVPPGMHQYKFLLDGAWLADPDNSDWAVSPLGTINSVVTAG